MEIGNWNTFSDSAHIMEGMRESINGSDLTLTGNLLIPSLITNPRDCRNTHIREDYRPLEVLSYALEGNEGLVVALTNVFASLLVAWACRRDAWTPSSIQSVNASSTPSLVWY